MSAATVLLLAPMMVLMLAACRMGDGEGQAREADGAPTRLELTSEVVVSAVTRLGINLGDQTFYDSGQMLRNLVFRNPGFEGLKYRSIVHCALSEPVCTETTGGIAWPKDFWNGARFTVLDRPTGAGGDSLSGMIAASGPAGAGYRLEAGSGGVGLVAGDWVAVEKEIPSDPAAGWWTKLEGGATLAGERKDLSPRTEGRQALRVEAGGVGQGVTLSSYFDSTEGRRFVQLHGRYRLSFRGKVLAGARSVHVEFGRAGGPPLLSRDMVLSSEWSELGAEFAAEDGAANGTANGAAELRFTVRGARVLLDDVVLEPVTVSPGAFREEVVQALKELHPGVLRLMSSHAGLGESVPELIAPPLGRERAGYSVWATGMEDVPIGVPEFLELCQRVDAEPWIVLPMAMSLPEARLIAEYLTQGAGSDGGRLRAGEGAVEPWSGKFRQIHLELGNEAWNTGFRGEAMEDPGAYGRHADRVFREIRRVAGAAGDRLDLVVNAQVGTQWTPLDRNRVLFTEAKAADTLAIAPYLMHEVDDGGSDRALFGPLLAEPEQMSRNGVVAKTAALTQGRKLAVYEVNLHSTEGAAPEEALMRLTPSAAAGVAVADHMLRMMRDHGARTEMLFSLSQFSFGRGDHKEVRLWGSVVDMGVTNRRRPQFLAEALVNEAMAGDMVRVRVTGADPTRDVAAGNDGVQLSGAHDLDAYGFTSREAGKVRHAMVVFNLSLEKSHTVGIAGPRGTVEIARMGGDDPAANNEVGEKVTVVREKVPSGGVVLPACSVTVVRWEE